LSKWQIFHSDFVAWLDLAFRDLPVFLHTQYSN
jgi:hypothetical protein